MSAVAAILVAALVCGTAGFRECPAGHFKLAHMPRCAPMLTCPQLGTLKVGKLIGVGGVKAVYNATWQQLPVALSILNNRKFAADFEHGQKMVLQYSGVANFIRVIGFCQKPALTLTEYHPYGSIANLSTIVAENEAIEDDVRFRLGLCKGWASVLKVLHGEGPIKETRVMCDSNSVHKLLSQILLDEKLQVVLNDLDALPLVGPGGIVCGNSQVDGDLVAPEQKWPFPDLPYSSALMPGYSEKVDVWKAGKLCSEHFLNVTGGAWARYRLFKIHRRALSDVPGVRPCASEMHQEYSNALAELTRDEL